MTKVSRTSRRLGALSLAVLALSLGTVLSVPARAESPLGDRTVAEARTAWARPEAGVRQVAGADTVIASDRTDARATTGKLPYDNRAWERQYYNVFNGRPFPRQ